MGMLIIDRVNWHGVITIIWGSIDREIRFILKVLKDYKNLADFIKRVEQIKYLIVFFARDLAPDRTLYASYGRDFYLFRSAYIECSCNLQFF